MRRISVAFFFLAVAYPACSESRSRVMIVVFENTSFEEALQQPSFRDFAARGALLTNYRAIAHPSQPNYIAMVAGTREGVEDDEAVNLDLPHLGDLIEAKGKAWKVYAEGYPGGCFLGEKQGRYVRKHVPFLSFRNVQRAPARCSRVVNASQLDADLASGALPDFSMYIPDLDNDGHDTDAAFAARWFDSRFGPLLENGALGRGTLLVATFDEDDKQGDNRVYTAVVGAGVTPGAVSDAPLTHYSLLRTVEDILGVEPLGRGDSRARSFAPLLGAKPKRSLRKKPDAILAPPDFSR